MAACASWARRHKDVRGQLAERSTWARWSSVKERGHDFFSLDIPAIRTLLGGVVHGPQNEGQEPTVGKSGPAMNSGHLQLYSACTHCSHCRSAACVPQKWGRLCRATWMQQPRKALPVQVIATSLTPAANNHMDICGVLDTAGAARLQLPVPDHNPSPSNSHPSPPPASQPRGHLTRPSPLPFLPFHRPVLFCSPSGFAIRLALP